ncbi:MAG: hypothetical protein RBU23_13575 [Candidatus Auribacterota bacterium]|jgi:hypothetical protein|nr:hypothetical protein [Candidatus Auribacterota bacterium]
MSSSIKTPSDNYKKAISALRRLLSEEGEEIVSRAFAEVTADARKANFINANKLEFPTENHICIHRLAGKPCPEKECYSSIIPRADYLSEWRKNGKTKMIVSQPYRLSFDEIKQTIAFCEEFGLEAIIEARSSWHFPSTTISVQYTRASKVTKSSVK